MHSSIITKIMQLSQQKQDYQPIRSCSLFINGYLMNLQQLLMQTLAERNRSITELHQESISFSNPMQFINEDIGHSSSHQISITKIAGLKKEVAFLRQEINKKDEIIIARENFTTQLLNFIHSAFHQEKSKSSFPVTLASSMESINFQYRTVVKEEKGFNPIEKKSDGHGLAKVNQLLLEQFEIFQRQRVEHISRLIQDYAKTISDLQSKIQYLEGYIQQQSEKIEKNFVLDSENFLLRAKIARQARDCQRKKNVLRIATSLSPQRANKIFVQRTEPSTPTVQVEASNLSFGRPVSDFCFQKVNEVNKEFGMAESTRKESNPLFYPALLKKKTPEKKKD